MSRMGFVFRLFAALVLLGLIAVGGYMVYQAGISQGVAQAPAVATAISKAAENGQSMPMYGPSYGYPHPYGFEYGHRFGFFPGGICFSIFFIFLIFGLLRVVFFRPWMHHRWHGDGHWGRKWEGGVPPMFDKWHKRAHGEEPKEEDDKKESS